MNQSCVSGELSLAMSYVPWQRWGDMYDECAALERGTAFPALFMPFMAGRATK